MSRSATILTIVVLLGWSYFARPIYDTARIAAGRGRDKLVEKIHSPGTSIRFDDVVSLNTRAVEEIDTYVHELRTAATNAPEITSLRYDSLPGYVASTKSLHDRLAASLRFPPPQCVLGSAVFPGEGVKTKWLGEDELATYTLLTVPAFAGVNSTGVLILPRKTSARVPLIIAAHGRGGVPEKPVGGSIPIVQDSGRDLALGAIRRGWAVYEPLFVFYGKDYPEDIRERLTVRAQEAGTTLPAIEFAKTMRALDYLCTRPEIDAEKIAMVGISYGGFNTLYTTALDRRIKMAVVAAYYNDRKTVLDDSEPSGFSDWRYPDSLGLLSDPNIAALICPRPLQIQAGNQDQLFPIEGARRAAPLARDFYEKLKIAGDFSFHEFVGRHDFDGEAAWDFIAAHWGNPSGHGR